MRWVDGCLLPVVMQNSTGYFVAVIVKKISLYNYNYSLEILLCIFLSHGSVQGTETE